MGVADSTLKRGHLYKCDNCRVYSVTHVCLICSPSKYLCEKCKLCYSNHNVFRLKRIGMAAPKYVKHSHFYTKNPVCDMDVPVLSTNQTESKTAKRTHIQTTSVYKTPDHRTATEKQTWANGQSVAAPVPSRPKKQHEFSVHDNGQSKIPGSAQPLSETGLEHLLIEIIDSCDITDMAWDSSQRHFILCDNKHNCIIFVNIVSLEDVVVKSIPVDSIGNPLSAIVIDSGKIVVKSFKDDVIDVTVLDVAKQQWSQVQSGQNKKHMVVANGGSGHFVIINESSIHLLNTDDFNISKQFGIKKTFYQPHIDDKAVANQEKLWIISFSTNEILIYSLIDGCQLGKCECRSPWVAIATIPSASDRVLLVTSSGEVHSVQHKGNNNESKLHGTSIGKVAIDKTISSMCGLDIDGLQCVAVVYKENRNSLVHIMQYISD